MSYCNRSHNSESIEQKGHTAPALSTMAYLKNMNSLLSFFTPTVPIKFLTERLTSEGQNSECKEIPYFSLEDLWESLNEQSVFGVGVPIILNEKENEHGSNNTKQYYVPSLSAIQLYVDSQTLGLGEDNSAAMSDKFDRLSLNEESAVLSEKSKLVYQYFEREKPHFRHPLSDMVSNLAKDFPALNKYKSCELSPTSWFSVAWYPIYRIPQGQTLKNLDTSFLTFHCLSTKSREGKYKLHASKLSLPSFALATYKMEGTIFNPAGESEIEEMKSQFRTAGDWLRSLEVYHNDYGFFASNFRFN